MGARILRDASPQRFYRRYPKSSRFARQMQDLDAALAWVRCSSGTNDTDPNDSCGGMTTAAAAAAAAATTSGSGAGSGGGGGDSGLGAQERYPGWTGGVPPLKRNVILAGYSIGGLQALTAAALDTHKQIAAVASFSGKTYVSLRHFILTPEYLPRRARDKHSENSNKRTWFKSRRLDAISD
jgi:hypothetical protein